MGLDDDKYDLGEGYNSYREKENKEPLELGKLLAAITLFPAFTSPLAAGMQKGMDDSQGKPCGLETIIACCAIATLASIATSGYLTGTKETPKDNFMRKLYGIQWNKAECAKGAVKGLCAGVSGSAVLAGIGYVLGRILGKV